MGAAVAGEEKVNRAIGKLVLFLADGTTLDIPLDHERVTVGRRSGNDVCLPYPAVSGAHAVFVTTATGVVMEDLGSTNGTTVNGTRTNMQVLHDGDRIDIGRQRFVYLADVNAVVPPLAARKSAGRRAGDNRGDNGRVGDAIDGVTVAHGESHLESPQALPPSSAPADAPAMAGPAATTELWLSRPGPSGSPDASNPASGLAGSRSPMRPRSRYWRRRRPPMRRPARF